MGSRSKIEWTDATWSPIRARLKSDALEIAKRKGYDSLVQILEKRGIRRRDGELRVGPHCEKVSAGCTHCYSEFANSRCLPANGTGLPFDRRSRDLVDVFVDEKILHQPLHWRKPRVIFVESQSDLYAEFVMDGMIDWVKAVEALCPQHFFLELTKRSERMRDYNGSPPFSRITEAMRQLPEGSGVICWPGWPFDHVGLGVSPHDQESADRMSEDLRGTPAAVRYVSHEPALGPVDWRPHFRDPNPCDACGGHHSLSHEMCEPEDAPGEFTGLDWVIQGGESGPGARPFDVQWARDVRDQCKAAGVPYFLKQLGAKPGQERDTKGDWYPWKLIDGKGGNEAEWPPDLQGCREYPRQILEHFEKQGITRK